METYRTNEVEMVKINCLQCHERLTLIDFQRGKKEDFKCPACNTEQYIRTYKTNEMIKISMK